MSTDKPVIIIDKQGKLNPAAAIYLMLSMTKRCNMRCPGCYYLQQDEDFFQQQDIDLEQARQIISYYRRLGVRQAIPNAEGDVLLHPDYPALVEHIHSLGFRFMPWLVTNGILLPDVADFVVGHVGEVLVSIDGSTAERYTAYRGGNEALFNKVLTGVRTLVDTKRRSGSRTEIIINCVMTADRCEDIPPMIRLAEELGVGTIKFTNFHVAGDGAQYKPVTLGDPAAEAVFQQVASRRDYRVNVFLPSPYQPVKPPYRCKMLASVMIGANGDFAPCCRIAPDARWGNLYKSPERHNNPALREFRLSVLEAKQHEDLPQVCQQCAHLSPRRLLFRSETRQWYLTDRS